MPKSQKRSNSRKQLSKKSKRSKKSKKSKKSKVSKEIKLNPQQNANKCRDAMNDPKLTALCMSCFRKSNKQIRQSLVSTKNRVCKKTKNGRQMILGYCAKCNGKMAKLL